MVKDGLLTKTARAALERYTLAGTVMVNQKKNGFDQFRATDALALMIAGVAQVEDGQLQLTGLGVMLTAGDVEEETAAKAVEWYVQHGPEYP